MSERSASYPLLAQNAQELPSSEIVTAPSTSGAGSFIASDCWVSIIPVVEIQNSGYRPIGNVGVVLSVDNNRTLVVSEPFYVSGKRSFSFFEAGTYLVTKASRRELLSQNPVFTGNSSDARETPFPTVSGSIGALSSAANWFYLDQNLSWIQDVIGNTGVADPFGFGTSVVSSRRGRYYDISYQFESTVGTLQAYIVHRIGSARPAFPIFLGPTGTTGISGIVHVGDNSPISPLGGFASAGHAQVSVLGSLGWTIAVTNNVAANLSGTLAVARRGF